MDQPKRRWLVTGMSRENGKSKQVYIMARSADEAIRAAMKVGMEQGRAELDEEIVIHEESSVRVTEPVTGSTDLVSATATTSRQSPPRIGVLAIAIGVAIGILAAGIVRFGAAMVLAYASREPEDSASQSAVAVAQKAAIVVHAADGMKYLGDGVYIALQGDDVTALRDDLLPDADVVIWHAIVANYGFEKCAIEVVPELMGNDGRSVWIATQAAVVSARYGDSYDVSDVVRVPTSELRHAQVLRLHVRALVNEEPSIPWHHAIDYR